ncbi:hypothetical protein JZ751_003214 [Albula glossodonta]|uniref:Uncharacterized protein n=1 Tax=Albula glossodonta TaxID=121402 RepID=A0A8T2NAF5_9TELE|nr:hypothetical protein JZ751_003214 [Albula glossodonta]
MNGHPENFGLKRELGLFSGISFIAGTMIGSGIFMSPQTVLLNVRSPGASLMIWAACGILVMLASLCYAELGTVIRKSGGTYIYITKTWGQPLAFKYIFICVLVMFPSSIAGLALSFAEYAVAPFYQGCPPPLLVVKCAAASGVIILSIVNSLNVRFSVYIQVFCLVAKVLALVVNLPRAVMIAIPMVTVLYLLVNVSYLAAMTPRELMSSSAVAVTWG